MFCSNRSSGVYPLNQGHMTKQPLAVNKWFYTPPPPPPPHTHTHTHTHRDTHTLHATAAVPEDILN